MELALERRGDAQQRVDPRRPAALLQARQDLVGHGFVEGAAVVATVVAHGRHDKVTIFKMKRRKHYQKHQGHRQNFTELRIDSIA